MKKIILALMALSMCFSSMAIADELPPADVTSAAAVSSAVSDAAYAEAYGEEHKVSYMTDADMGTSFKTVEGDNSLLFTFGEVKTIDNITVISNLSADDMKSFNMTSLLYSSDDVYSYDTARYVAYSSVDEGEGVYTYTYSLGGAEAKNIALSIWESFGNPEKEHMEIFDIKIYEKVLPPPVYVEKEVASTGTVNATFGADKYGEHLPANIADGNEETYFGIPKSLTGWQLMSLKLDKAYLVKKVTILTNGTENDANQHNLATIMLANGGGANAAWDDSNVRASGRTTETTADGKLLLTYDFSSTVQPYSYVGLELNNFGGSEVDVFKMYEMTVTVLTTEDGGETEVPKPVTEEQCVLDFAEVSENNYQPLISEWKGIINPDNYKLISTASAAESFIHAKKTYGNDKLESMDDIKKYLAYTEMIEALCRLSGTELETIVEKNFDLYFDTGDVYSRLKEDGIDVTGAFAANRTDKYTAADEAELKALFLTTIEGLVFGINENTKAEYTNIIGKYIDLMPEMSEKIEAYTEKYPEGFEDYCVIAYTYAEGSSVAEKTESTFEKALFLAYMNEGTPAEIEKEITENGNLFLSADVLKKLEDSEITAAELANELKSKSFKTAEEIANMGTTVETLINSLEEIKEEPSAPVSTGGISGGGGSSKKSSSIAVVASKPVEEKTETKQEMTFDDLQQHGWAKDAIQRLHSKGILNGRGDGKFDPDAYVTRAEFVKMLVLSLDMMSGAQKTDFSDVSIDDWYYPYINAATVNGVVSGRGDGSFGAGEYISRQDMAVMAERASKLEAAGDVTGFSDASEISSYAQNAMSMAVGSGLLSGYTDGTIRPKNNVTRAEAAVFIDRMTGEV